MTERDTHFYNAATFLYEKLAKNVMASEKGLSDVEAFKQEQYTIIAQFAYDLVEHTLENSNNEITFYPEDIPDLKQWPGSPTPE